MSQDSKFLSTVMRGGTVSDRSAALSLKIHKSPLHAFRELESLIGLCKKKGRREASAAVDAAKELFLTVLLPDRKLKSFSEQPLSVFGPTDLHLAMWIVEARIKSYYNSFISAINAGASDIVTYFKDKCIKCMVDLLMAKPELEKVLLELIVNKLGDPNRSTASKTGYWMRCLLEEHPKMKNIVVTEVENFLFRSGISPRAQYYALIFLNQMILTHAESRVALHLVDIYMKLFVVKSQSAPHNQSAKKENSESSSKKGKEKSNSGKKNKGNDQHVPKSKDEDSQSDLIDTRLLSALLTGISRAWPYVEPTAWTWDDKHLKMLFAVAHGEVATLRIPALSLLFKVCLGVPTLEPRFYGALYGSLLHRNSLESSNSLLYFKLLFQALKVETIAPELLIAFVRRLMQVSLFAPFALAISTQYLLSELAQHHVVLQEYLQLAASEGGSSEGNPLEGEGKEKATYDPLGRMPQFAGANSSPAWEGHLQRESVHPTLAMFASACCGAEKVKYNGDPLQDFTLTAFLDRFMQRAPKKDLGEKGGSLMQPRRVGNLRAHGAALPMSGWHKNAAQLPDSNDVRADDLFQLRFYEIQQKIGNLAPGEKEVTEDAEEAASDVDDWDEEALEAALEEEMWSESENEEGLEDDDDAHADNGSSEGEGNSLGGNPLDSDGSVDDQDAWLDDGNTETAMETSRKGRKQTSVFADLDDYADILTADSENVEAKSSGARRYESGMKKKRNFGSSHSHKKGKSKRHKSH